MITVRACPFAPLLLALCAMLAAPAAHAEPSLKDVLEAARNSIEIRLARQAEVGASADVQSADHAPLPVLSGKVSQIDLQNGIGAGDPFGRKRLDKSIGVDWTWERGDKRAHRTRAANKTLAATQAETAETSLQQMLAAQGLYFDWLAARERVRLTQAMAESASDAAHAANTRLRVGDLSAQDALRVEIDAQRVAADVQAAQLDRDRAEIALAVLVERAELAKARASAVQWPTLASDRRSTGGDAGATEALIRGRGDVRAAQLRHESAQASYENALALRQVDPTWGISFDHYPGTSTRLVELRVQIPLTWGYRYQGEIARAQSDVAAAELAAERALRDARTEIDRLRIEAATHRARLSQFETDILPRAATVLKQAEFAFARGAMSLTDLLDARRTYRSTQLDALAARADASRAEAALLLRTEPGALLR